MLCKIQHSKKSNLSVIETTLSGKKCRYFYMLLNIRLTLPNKLFFMNYKDLTN